MSVKKRVKVGRIEPSADGTAIVVHLTTEVTHFDDSGAPGGVERMPDKREVPVARALRRARQEDLPDLAQEVADKCRYIPASKVRQVEQVLAKLLAAQAPAAQTPTPSPQPRSRPKRGARAVEKRRSSGVGISPRPGAMLPEALIENVDDYADELYEEQMDAKADGARRVLRLCTDVQPLEEISEHPTLLGVLSRELRENAKRSHELAVAIAGIFLCLAHFSQFHSALGRHNCGEATLRVVEFEGKRVKALQKELKLAQGKLAARGAEASRDEQQRFEREERRCCAVVERQDRLVHLCVMILRNLAEDVNIERKIVAQRICQMLIPLLSRTSEDFLLCVLGFLHKLSVFLVNKDSLVQSAEALNRLSELAGHASADISLLALRLCYNLSFDLHGRKALATQTGLLGRLLATFQLTHMRAVSLKLLYHLSMDAPTRTLIGNHHSACIGGVLQLIASRKEKPLEREAMAFCINVAGSECCAVAMLGSEHFPRVAERAVQQGDPLLLKIFRSLAAHEGTRARLLRFMKSEQGSANWLSDLTRLACHASERPELLVEALGTLAALDCASPAVPWPAICSLGLLELMHRLMMVGFSSDDVLLECAILTGVLALDPACVSLLAASKVPSECVELLGEKQDDCEIMVQLLFTIRCLLLQEETREVLLHRTDAPERVLDLLEVAQRAADAKSKAVQTMADAVLDLVVELEEQDDREPRWTPSIKSFRFEVHNQEWVQMLRRGDQNKPCERKTSAENRSASRWTDVEVLADRCWGGSDSLW